MPKTDNGTHEFKTKAMKVMSSGQQQLPSINSYRDYLWVQ